MSFVLLSNYAHSSPPIATHRELSNKVFQLDRTVSRHDKAITELMNSMQQVLTPPTPPKRPIGFVYPEESKSKSRAAKK